MWFVGAPVSLEGALDGAFSRDESIALTSPGDRHVTLLYLGRVPSDSALRVWRSLPPLSLPARVRPRRWELFGRRAVALSLADDDGRLRTAAEACVAVAEGRLPSFRRPSELRPHVTLGRVRKDAVPPTPAAMRAWSVPTAPVGLGPLTLFRLRDAPTGDRYEVVEQGPVV